MCGITGYIGNRNGADVVFAGLQALEYRGYDSAGIALIDAKKQAHLLRQVGRVENLKQLMQEQRISRAPVAIGHTRWATHGEPAVCNAHPHPNSNQSIFVVHNGIIENSGELRERLEKNGYVFASQTDTEVLPHLIDHYYQKTHAVQKAIIAALAEVRGAYAILVASTHEPDKLYAARLSSPLVLGVGKRECIVASDSSAIMECTKDVVYLHDNELATITGGTYKLLDLTSKKAVGRKPEQLDFDVVQASKGSYETFMLKEINEAPQTIRLATLGRSNAHTKLVKLGGLEQVAEQLQHVDRIVIVACGTSSYAGMVGEYLIEELAGIPVEVQLASEFKYRDEPFSRSTAVIAISQSGETADTIAALKKVEKYGVLRLGVVNATGSTIARITDAGVYCHAGPEQAVASTKAFIAQVVVLLLMALHLARKQHSLYASLLKEIDELPGKAEAVLATAKHIAKIAKKYQDDSDFLFIGRRYAYPCALEGALKLKEISYIHAEGYAAGEMKHGPLAMIDPKFPTFAIATDTPLLEKTISNIQEIRARKGRIIAIATEGNSSVAAVADDVLYIPKAAEQVQTVLVAIVMQLFAYHIATARGLNVDRPRNLAKSVTVE